MPLSSGKAIMCAYKLCRVEFHYWGMQSKIEKFIHDYGKYFVMADLHNLFLCSGVIINCMFLYPFQRIEKNNASSSQASLGLAGRVVRYDNE